MNLKKELASNKIVLLAMQAKDYNNVFSTAIKQLKGNVCYVTANKTFDSIKETFNKKKVNTEKIVFIDTISKSLKKVPGQGDGVYYVSSPGALTELSLVINKFLKHNFNYLVFDAITNLSIYQNKNICSKFLLDLISKINKTKTKAVFYAIESKENEDIISKLSTMVDKVISPDGKAIPKLKLSKK